MYEIYIDVVFLVNLLPEYIILSLLARTLHYRTSTVRIIGGSMLSSLLTCILCLLPDMPYIIRFVIAYLLGKTFILWLVFRIRRLHVLLKAMLLVYGFTLLMGGFLEWICQTPFFVGERQIDITAFILLTGTAYALGMALQWLWKYLRGRTNRICRVEILYLDNKIEVNGLYDTGNLLTEPISGSPVSILGQEQAQHLDYCQRSENYRVIPYYSVGNPGGILHGFTADEMRIETDMGMMVVQKPVIGVCKEKISKNGVYGLIIHPKLMNQ